MMMPNHILSWFPNSIWRPFSPLLFAFNYNSYSLIKFRSQFISHSIIFSVKAINQLNIFRCCFDSGECESTILLWHWIKRLSFYTFKMYFYNGKNVRCLCIQDKNVIKNRILTLVLFPQIHVFNFEKSLFCLCLVDVCVFRSLKLMYAWYFQQQQQRREENKAFFLKKKKRKDKWMRIVKSIIIEMNGKHLLLCGRYHGKVKLYIPYTSL